MPSTAEVLSALQQLSPIEALQVVAGELSRKRLSEFVRGAWPVRS